MLAKNTVVFTVEGMSCSHCKAAVEKALQALGGVDQARVDLQRARVEVEYEPSQVTEEELKGAIGAVGYEVLS